jgi:hypothetical protein
MAVDRAFYLLAANTSTKLATLTTAVASGTLFGVDITGARLRTRSVGGLHLASLEVPIAAHAALRAAVPGGVTGWQMIGDATLIDAADDPWDLSDLPPYVRAIIALRGQTETVAP